MKKRSSKSDRESSKKTLEELEAVLRADRIREAEEAEASMSPEERAEYDAHKRRVAFNEKYVLRKDYERDLELEKSQGRLEAVIFCIFVLPPMLVCLFLILRAIGWIEPGDFGLG